MAAREKTVWSGGAKKIFRNMISLCSKKYLHQIFLIAEVIVSLFTWSKQMWLFWRIGFFPANQSFLNTFSIALIGWIKAGLPKKPLLFWSCKQAKYLLQKKVFTKNFSIFSKMTVVYILWSICAQLERREKKRI